MRVTADRAFNASRNGELSAFEAGDVVDGDLAEYLATTGAPVTVVEGALAESGGAPTPPAASAPKTAWVAHAVAQGADAAAAASMTKAALIAEHGAAKDDPPPADPLPVDPVDPVATVDPSPAETGATVDPLPAGPVTEGDVIAEYGTTTE